MNSLNSSASRKKKEKSNPAGRTKNLENLDFACFNIFSWRHIHWEYIFTLNTNRHVFIKLLSTPNRVPSNISPNYYYSNIFLYSYLRNIYSWISNPIEASNFSNKSILISVISHYSNIFPLLVFKEYIYSRSISILISIISHNSNIFPLLIIKEYIYSQISNPIEASILPNKSILIYFLYSFLRNIYIYLRVISILILLIGHYSNIFPLLVPRI